MVLCIVLGPAALGCFTITYRVPPSDTPAAVVRVAGVPIDYVRFDVFYADEGWPDASQTLWNSPYLGSVEIRHLNQSRLKFSCGTNATLRLPMFSS